jgi:hypothetical protein
MILSPTHLWTRRATKPSPPDNGYPIEEAPSHFQSLYTAGKLLTKQLEEGKARFDLIELDVAAEISSYK